jgi:hypothetical protein
MIPVRLSRLHTRMCLWCAGEEKRSRGMIASAHQALIGALPRATGKSSHRLGLLEPHDFVVIGRTLGGNAASRSQTAAGRQQGASLSEGMHKE